MEDTKTQIIDAAEILIRTKGYSAFSYTDISAPLQVKNAAIHYHFPSKSDLGQAVIEKNRSKFQNEIKLWQSFSATNKIKALISVFEKSSSENLVCFMGALGPSYNVLPENMQSEIAKASHEMRDWLQTVLKEGQSSGQFKFKETIREKADIIISSLLSSLILIRVMDTDILTSVRNGILKTL